MEHMTAPEPDRVDEILAQWSVERPDLDVSPVGVIGRLHRIAERLRDELVALYREYGLGEGEFDVLATLRRTGAPYELAPGELAAHTMVTTGAVSKRLDRLEALGYVQRRSSDRDGRGRVVGLTAAGVAAIDEAFAAHVRNEARLLEGLDPEQRAQMIALLRVWMRALDG
ncbi:MarR family transcriptional regulator [Leucobacter sp. OLJS4]|nr:MarR family transcriptional regulator [Leucobacter sp. OLCALW19]PII87067.1 MarR family transcriptional regulator [Leucobacter sp. OLTLW20]PII91356.1 MarR family transcriptional regulator [Leucobacter sp. OLAS13]PII98815.1 MarR family transcriptional regulator [Leucobacter sp. OLDS2]PIJ04068.1 MarR family transcriptional regulator [Leucobacter sp. OLIS6]PIJ04178.1 MarR family transcriptional regulator [Leucobacter sp. OLCS4]PIJ08138.1 MarR family transcriptional regulator [Leucobacter sp. O